MKTRSFLRLLLKSSCILPLLLASCTMPEAGISEVGTSAPASEFPVRFPAIRLSNRPVVTIDSLMADKDSEKVAVEGTVAARVGILEGWLYQLDDGTGSVWVLSDGSEPEVGQLATVEGVVHYEAITVGDIDAGDVYLEEQAYRQSSE